MLSPNHGSLMDSTVASISMSGSQSFAGIGRGQLSTNPTKMRCVEGVSSLVFETRRNSNLFINLIGNVNLLKTFGSL